MDDEDLITYSVSRYFAARGFVVHSAAEQHGAAELLAQHHYSAVILDLRLRGLRGTEGLELLRHIQETSPGTPTLLLTAYVTEYVTTEASRLGVSLVLPKPQPLPTLLERVRELMANRTRDAAR